MSGTTYPIHPVKQPHTITRFYHYMIAGWNVEIYASGAWKAEQKETT